ncbi:MAG: ABC transporter substrate-binding protein [Myxococcales bacterium]
MLLSWVLAACPGLPDGPRYEGAGKPGPRRGGTLMLSEQQRVRSLDPHLVHDVISGAVIEMLFDGLYEFDAQMKLSPDIAAELPVYANDGKVLRIRLRQGVRFQNGREITAEDVVWSLERMLHPRTHSPGALFYRLIVGFEEYRAGKASHVEGLRVLERYQFEIRLSEADQTFAPLLAMRFATPVPREEVLSRGAEFARRPVGSGPFRLASWDPGVRLVLERNPRYGAGLPHVDRVVVEEAIALETAFLRFRNAEVDVMTRVTPADRAVLQGSRKWRPYFEASPSVDIWGLVMNCELPPFDNVHVRRAVASAIDRERWVKVRSGNLRAAGQMVPPQLIGYDPKLPHLQVLDLANAHREMALAGFPNGWPEPVTLWIPESATARIYAELAQADLAAIGIRAEIKGTTFPVFLESQGTPKTVQLSLSGWQMDYPDPSNFLGLLHSKSRGERSSINRAFYSSPTLDGLLDRARVEPDPTQRARLYRDANDLVAHDAPWAFFGNNLVPQAWQPYVKNYRPHAVYWMPVNEVWLDLPKRKLEQLAQALSPLPGARVEMQRAFAIRGRP